MLVKALVDFDYAHDGRNAARIRAGKSVEVRDELVDRFVAEGRIADPRPRPTPSSRPQRRRRSRPATGD